jgi:hypothetical protein
MPNTNSIVTIRVGGPMPSLKRGPQISPNIRQVSNAFDGKRRGSSQADVERLEILRELSWSVFPRENYLPGRSAIAR